MTHSGRRFLRDDSLAWPFGGAATRPACAQCSSVPQSRPAPRKCPFLVREMQEMEFA